MFRQLVLLIAAVGVPLLFLQFRQLEQDSRRTREAAFRAMENDAAGIAHDAQTWLVDTSQYLDFIARRPMVRSMDGRHCDPLLEDVSKRRRHVANVLVTDAAGKPTCLSVRGPGPVPESWSGWPWFQAAQASDRFTVSKPFMAPVIERLVAAASAPVRDAHGTRVGTVTVLLDLESLQGDWSRYALPPNSRVLLYDASGTILTARPAFRDLVGKDIGAALARAQVVNPGDTGIAPGIDGVERAFAHKPVPLMQWEARVSIPSDDLLGPSRREYRENLAITAAVLIAVIVLALLMSRRMVGALNALVEAARAIGGGRLDVRAPHDLPGEFGEVAHEFNTMLDAGARHLDFYKALSRTNGAIVRSTSAQALYEEICRICVENGHASIAYVSLVDGDTLTHVAWAGPADDFVRNLKVHVADRTVTGSGLSGLAAFTGQRQISNDVYKDPRTLPWRDFGAAIGTHAIAACPFRCAGRTIGTLTLHMTSVGFFGERVIDLLDEMTEDMSFALDNFARAEALRMHEQQLAGLVDTAMDAIISIDARYRIQLFNRAAGEMFLVEPGSMLGQTLDRFVPRRLQMAHHGHLEQFSKTGSTARRMGLHSLSAVRADGREFPIEASISRLGQGESALMTVVIRDATDLRQAQEARIAQVAAESASRAKTDFLSRMSHELRTPLNAVLGFAQLLQGDKQEPMTSSQFNQVERIRVAGWHLLALINDVLDVSKIEAGHVSVEDRRVDVLDVLEEAIRINQPGADELGIRVIATCRQAQPVSVWGDPRRLRQIVINLLSNAIKYNRPAGSVEVRVAGDAHHTHIDIIDTGIGMDSGQLEHLYEPFNRLGRERNGIEGTGLGLALTRQLVHLMHGEIEVHSTVGVGTRMRVTLRTNLEPDSQPGTLEPQSEGGVDADEPAGLVLYIEDNAVNFMVVEHLLLRWPRVTLLHAETGAQGVALARSAAIDLVLLDMRLPDMEGADVLAELRLDPTTRGLRVVALSASAMPEEVDAAAKAGALQYWTKPLEFDSFLKNMRRLLSPVGHV
jgi:PAS domain S-box-containing protein